MEVILLAADLNREEIGLFKGLHKLFLVLELLHVADLAIEGAADALCHCHSTSIFVQLNFVNGRRHNTHRTVYPVQGERGSDKLTDNSSAVHAMEPQRAYDSHSALEADFLDLKWHESFLLALS